MNDAELRRAGERKIPAPNAGAKPARESLRDSARRRKSKGEARGMVGRTLGRLGARQGLGR